MVRLEWAIRNRWQPLASASSLLRLHDRSDTPYSAGLLWTSGQSDAEASTWQHTSITRDKHPCPRRNSNPHSQASGHSPHGHRDRPKPSLFIKYKTLTSVAERFAMYITCGIVNYNTNSTLAHEQLQNMKLSGLHFRPFVLLFAVLHGLICCCVKLDAPGVQNRSLGRWIKWSFKETAWPLRAYVRTFTNKFIFMPVEK